MSTAPPPKPKRRWNRFSLTGWQFLKSKEPKTRELKGSNPNTRKSNASESDVKDDPLPQPQNKSIEKSWYYRPCHQSNCFGPFSTAQIKQLAAAGEVDPRDLLRLGFNGQWVPASQFSNSLKLQDRADEASRWYQFSLKTLLVVMLIFSVTVGWIGSRMRKARENRDRVAAVDETVVAIRKLGGNVTSEYDQPPPQTWLERQFDDPSVGKGHVTGVQLGYRSVSDYIAAQYRWCGCGVNNRPLRVYDAGLEHVKGLTKLERLGLIGTRVTDTGLEHLKGLNNLRDLDLRHTKVTDEGVKKLQQALPKCKIVR